MNKSISMSVQPKWVAIILNKKKTINFRKNALKRWLEKNEKINRKTW